MLAHTNYKQKYPEPNWKAGWRKKLRDMPLHTCSNPIHAPRSMEMKRSAAPPTAAAETSSQLRADEQQEEQQMAHNPAYDDGTSASGQQQGAEQPQQQQRTMAVQLPHSAVP